MHVFLPLPLSERVVPGARTVSTSPGAVKDQISTSQLVESAPFGRNRKWQPRFPDLQRLREQALAASTPILLNQEEAGSGEQAVTVAMEAGLLRLVVWPGTTPPSTELDGSAPRSAGALTTGVVGVNPTVDDRGEPMLQPPANGDLGAGRVQPGASSDVRLDAGQPRLGVSFGPEGARRQVVAVLVPIRRLETPGREFPDAPKVAAV